MAEILRVRSILQYGTGSPGLNTFYFLPGTAGGVVADAEDVVGRVQDFWDAASDLFKTTMSMEVVAQVDVIEATTGELTGFLDGGTDTVVAGSSTAEMLPVAGMILLQLLTGDVHAGRRVRGRSYLGPVTDSANDGGIVAIASRNIATAAGAALLTGVTASTLVVWSRPDSPPGDPGFHSEVLQFGSPSYFAVLRSRRD